MTNPCPALQKCDKSYLLTARRGLREVPARRQNEQEGADFVCWETRILCRASLSGFAVLVFDLVVDAPEDTQM